MKYVPDYQIHLIDPSRLTKEEVLGLQRAESKYIAICASGAFQKRKPLIWPKFLSLWLSRKKKKANRMQSGLV